MRTRRQRLTARQLEVHEQSKVVKCGKLHMKALEHDECVEAVYRADGLVFSTRLPCNDPEERR